MSKWQFYSIFIMVLTMLTVIGANVQIKAEEVKNYYIEVYKAKKFEKFEFLSGPEMKTFLIETSTLSFF